MLRIDHLVVNIDKKYQTDKTVIQSVRNTGFPYEPKWGKGTKGFKASNIWIGNEYLEMIHLLKNDGGGWKAEWVEKYNKGHRGLICLMLDVDDLDKIYEEMIDTNITKPQYLQFKWGFGLFTKTMPWRNSYFPFFEGVPLQIGLQQMKDENQLNLCVSIWCLIPETMVSMEWKKLKLKDHLPSRISNLFIQSLQLKNLSIMV